MPHKRRNESEEDYRIRNKLYARAYRIKYPHIYKNHNNKYRKLNREKVKLMSKSWYINIRNNLIKMLGNRCYECDKTDNLEIVSVDGSTCKERKKIFKSQHNLYIYYRDNPDLAKKNLQILCKYHRCKRHIGKTIIWSEQSKEIIRKARAKTILPLKDTDIEIILQNKLTSLGIPFKKHKMICLKGSFYHQVDIFIPPNICIEADGDYWHSLPTNVERDIIVNSNLMKMGYIVLRFKGSEIKSNINYVINTILETTSQNIRV